jgi:hypothetical protein
MCNSNLKSGHGRFVGKQKHIEVYLNASLKIKLVSLYLWVHCIEY